MTMRWDEWVALAVFVGTVVVLLACGAELVRAGLRWLARREREMDRL